MSAMVRLASTKAIFEPVVTGQQWKGKPRLASFVQGSPVAACYRPPASATGTHYLGSITSASEATFSFGGDYFAQKQLSKQCDRSRNTSTYVIRRRHLHSCGRPPFAVFSHYGSFHCAGFGFQGQLCSCQRWPHPHPCRLRTELPGAVPSHAAGG